MGGKQKWALIGLGLAALAGAYVYVGVDVRPHEEYVPDPLATVVEDTIPDSPSASSERNPRRFKIDEVNMVSSAFRAGGVGCVQRFAQTHQFPGYSPVVSWISENSNTPPASAPQPSS